MAETTSEGIGSTPSAPSGGQTPGGSAGSVDPAVYLASLVAEREFPSAPANQELPTATPHVAPGAASEHPTETRAVGETDLASGEDAPQTGAETQEGVASDDLSQTDSTRASDPEGFKRRVGKLLGENRQLQERVAALETELRTAQVESLPTAELPEDVAKLKTVADVEREAARAKTLVRRIQRELDMNPGGPDTEHELDGQTFRRQQLVEFRELLSDKLDTLPKRRAQIEAVAANANANAAQRAALARDWPVLQDPEAQTTQLFNRFMRLPHIASQPAAPVLAFTLARGYEAMTADLAARRNNGPGRTAVAAGRVPAGKPHTGGGAAAAQPTAGGQIRSALDRFEKESSNEAFAALLKATGR